MAKAFQKGDFRSGYYRDQTFMMALGELSAQQFFAGLYAHTDIKADPMSAGRQMGGHFATHSLDENGQWKKSHPTIQFKLRYFSYCCSNASIGRVGSGFQKFLDTLKK